MKNKPSREEQQSVSKLAHDFLASIYVEKEARHMTYEDLAVHIGVSPQRISQIFSECGNLTLRTLVTWAAAVGMEPVITLQPKK